MALAPELLEAYKKAEYVVSGEVELVLRIGVPSADLDELLDRHAVQAAAFISPGNRRGKRQSESENAAAFLELNLLLKETSYARRAAEGRDPSGEWPAEASVLILGIGRREAEKLGRSLEQNAIVFVEKGNAPQLIILE
jgi:hypothetical protein